MNGVEMTKWTATVLSLALACLTVVFTPTAGSAAGAGHAALIATQGRLLPSANRILMAARDADGYAGMSAAPESGRVTLYWKGALPKELAAMIEAEPVPFSVVQARYSLAELLAETEKVVRQPGVSAVGPLTDGSGLSVSMRGSALGVQALEASRSAAVPVQVEGDVAPVLFNRQNDSSPYFGGAIIKNGNGICTSGFALKVGAVTKMLTAGHCGENGDVIKDGGGQVMGTAEQKNQTRDTLLIGVNSAGYTFTGPYTSNTYKPAKLALGSIDETFVCTSGANTGQHCPIRIKALNQFIPVCDHNGQNCVTMGPLVRAEQEDHLVAAGAGDSGGPVVATDSCGQFGCTFVNNYPMGTITAGDGNASAACGPTAFPTQCSWRIFYADVTLSAAHYGAQVVIPSGRLIIKP
jgi:hypothetical protein